MQVITTITQKGQLTIQKKQACLISYDKDFDRLPILKKRPKEVLNLVK